nr:PAS domain S-box protein [Bacteroidota bacterium]
MDNSLRILILEDNDLDKKILSLYLERSEINYDLRIVDTEKDFRKGLLDFHPDIVLADYMLPNFNGLEALEIHKSICPDIPFIFVTGQLSEETAIDCLRHGAWDYILKNRIKRLPIAIKSAVKLRHEIREKEKNEIEIRNSELRFRNMIENISDGILIIENDRVTYFNENARNFLELDNTDPTDVNIKHYIPIEKYQKIEAFFRAGEPDTNLFVEFEKHYPSETDFEHCLLVKLSAGISQGHDKNLYFTISDITQKRLQQREESLKFRFTQRISNAQSPEELFEITALTLEEYLQVKNFFIAILQSDTDVISTIYLKDERDMPSQFPAGNTITSKVIKTQELIFLKDADISNLIMEENTKLVGIRSLVWMGVPFQTTRYKGAVVIQDYENENLISKNDIGLIRFITEEIGRQIERKYTFEEIKLSEEKFNRITNSANDAIILMDHMGNVSFWNRAAANLFQYTEDEIIGKNLHDFLAPKKYHQEHKAGFLKFLSTGEGPYIGKTVILDAYKKDGSVVHVELSLSSLKMHGNWNAV